MHPCHVARRQAGWPEDNFKQVYDERDRENTILSSAPKGQPKMWVLEDYPSSEEKPIMNLEALSLESSFVKTPSLVP